MAEYTELLQELLQQEKEYQFTAFTNQTAIQLGNAILEQAASESKQIVVDIRRNGQVLFHAKMDGTSPNNDRWIARKMNVVNHFGHSSYYMNVLYKSWDTTIKDNAYVDPMEYAAEGGCFPLLIKNVGPVGTIAVSGLPGNEDHGMIIAGLKKLIQS